MSNLYAVFAHTPGQKLTAADGTVLGDAPKTLVSIHVSETGAKKRCTDEQSTADETTRSMGCDKTVFSVEPLQTCP